ncbi:MAG TPA: peptidoglycan-binding protein [Chthoniobacterales bacterium]|nr:peptidoglycan-binding protein [Chthoniobacterales bacterium]
MILAVGSLLALAMPAQAQRRGNHGGGNHGNFHHGHFHNGSRVNFFFGGFGYPFYYGYPYYGYYPYYYGYPYGYPVGGAYYSYDPQGVYEGRMANPPRRTNDGGKDYSMAARVQRQLAAAGYYEGEIDGIVGEGTRRAIRNYQRANNLAVDGRINDDLLGAMGLG